MIRVSFGCFSPDKALLYGKFFAALQIRGDEMQMVIQDVPIPEPA